MNINELISKIKKYNDNEEEIELIKKAYELANEKHKDQKRQSGEPYIIHPLEVANILTLMSADTDTICAALLHDVVEDTDTTKEEIEKMFNKDVAELVDAVTKFGKMTYADSDELFAANHRKMLVAASKDVRSILIKLADRLHNMRTLEYKSAYKQKEKSLETMQIYVPLAYYMGAYYFKDELEDISFRYLKPELYKEINERLQIEKDANIQNVENVRKNALEILKRNNINCSTRVGSKTVYGTYKKIQKGRELKDIHNLFEIILIVDTVEDCYRALGKIHSIYVPINNRFKDYIALPKTNLYTSLHTTVFEKNGTLVQFKIRTKEMDRTNIYGIGAYYLIDGKEAHKKMQKELTTKFQFFKALLEINSTIEDNKEFINLVRNEILTTNVYVYSPKGDAFELPTGSTALDFAYKLHTKIGTTMSHALINGVLEPREYVLKNKDRIKVICLDEDTVKKSDLEIVKTTSAKNKINDFFKNKKGN